MVHRQDGTRIDKAELEALLHNQGEPHPKIKGKIISVVNQIPFHCILNRHKDVPLNERVKLNTKRPREASVGSTAPISELIRRRSTLPSLGETELWGLSPRRSHSAMYAGIESLKKDYDTLYIGSTIDMMNDLGDPVSADSLSEQDRQSLEKLLMDKQKMVPIFINDDLAHDHYEGYCKHVLWPVLHYMMWNENVDEKKYWEAYVAVNRIFAETVVRHYKPGDIIWIHNYHLFLVPTMIREVLPDAVISLFVHTPFVSSEIFRCVPRRKDILVGILGCNLVSFQTYNYARHFASNCTRILGYEYTPAGVDANGRVVSLGIHPIGIDVDRVRSYCRQRGVLAKVNAMQNKYKNKKIVIGRDKLDPVKGVLQKLEAFEKFLEDYPEWREDVVLIQVTTPSAVGSHRLETKVSETVTRINSRFGSLEFSPVHHFYQHIDRDEYYALLTVGDVMLVTPTADGMNTTSLEYIVAQEQGQHSPLILSEFTGTSGSLSSAVIVNPYGYEEVARALHQCLIMTQEEKDAKFQELDRFVSCHTASYWAHSLVRDTVSSVEREKIWRPAPLLDQSRLKTEYAESRKRIFFLDYDGTLTPICEKPEEAVPSPETLLALERLCADTNNVVWVVSGRDQDFLEKHLGYIPRLGLSGEHGCFIRDPNSTVWRSMIDQLDMSWKDDVREIFQYYTERTPGSFIEDKRCAITWHYRTADAKFGAFQAKECQNHLEQSIISKLPVETLVGKKTLEVRPLTINKGEVIKRAISHYPDAGFVLCAGDDKTDEDMFRVLAKMNQGGFTQLIFTIMIGSKDKCTMATWRKSSPEDFVQSLLDLTKE